MWEGKVKTIRALERALDVLQILQEAKAMELKDLHHATGLPKATLLRVLKTLQGKGLIWRRMVDRAYLPSFALQRRAHTMDEEARLLEVASPILEKLCRQVSWPSVLAVPRLDHMEVIETNKPVSYVSHIILTQVGFKVNMLPSATGITYLAFCPEGEREAILARLRASTKELDADAHDEKFVARRIKQTQQNGYGIRSANFGGHTEKTRKDYDDGRLSIAAPIMLGDRVLGCINVTWTAKLADVASIAAKHLDDLREATRAIAIAMEH